MSLVEYFVQRKLPEVCFQLLRMFIEGYKSSVSSEFSRWSFLLFKELKLFPEVQSFIYFKELELFPEIQSFIPFAVPVRTVHHSPLCLQKYVVPSLVEYKISLFFSFSLSLFSFFLSFFFFDHSMQLWELNSLTRD